MFFFFESETEKRVREDIEKNMDICLENPKKYAQAMEVLTMHINSSDQKSIQKIVDTIKATIKNEDLQPIRKYQAILLLSDLMKSQNKALGKYVVKKILKRLTILAQHKNGTKEEGDQDRGRDIFGEVASSQQTYSINFLNTLLTALQEWGTNWPKAPDGPYKDFHREYNELVMNGVKFPKKRPKQVSKSPPPTRNSISPAANNAGRSSTLTKKPSQLQLDKPKSKSKAPVKEVKKSLSPELLKQLSDFYEKVKESMGVFYELLQSSSIEVLVPLLRDIFGEIQTNSDRGTELLIKLQSEQRGEAEKNKIQSYFTFLQKMEKDLNIVSKKSQKFQIYKSKYLKLAKSCLDLMSQPMAKGSASENTESKLEPKKEESQLSKKDSYMTAKQPEKKEEPKIKSQNRYLSVTGVNVLGPNPNQFGSGGQNGSVQRFGSFGGIETDRHRASIPISSPRGLQKQVSSDKKQPKGLPSESEVSKKQPEKEVAVAVTQKTTQTMNKVVEKPQPDPKFKPEPQKVQKVEVKVEVKSEQNLHNSNNFFKEFPVEEKRASIKNDITNPFKDNDSFGAFGKQTVVQNDQSPDFFGKIESGDNKANIQNLNPRRNAGKKPQEVDIFAPSMKSELSDGLSAFVKNENSQLSGNKGTENRLGQDTGSKKSINFQNPFGNEFTERQSQRKSETNSVGKNIDSNPFNSNIFQKSGIFQPGNQEDINRKFQTGNFGKVAPPEQKKQESVVKEVPNPFETSSVKSKKDPFQSSGNPFLEQFQKKSRHSQASKKSKQSQNPFDVESLHRNAPDPFQTNNIRLSNPFQTSTHKSQKSNRGIDDILELFKPPSKEEIKAAEKLSFKKSQQRDSKKIEDKPVSMNSQQVRQSIVFTVNLNQEAEPAIRFSQFQDIAASNVDNNPFDKPNDHEQSGFSLSKFGDMNDPFQGGTALQKSQDFFGVFEQKLNKSKDSRSQHSSHKNIKVQNQPQPFTGFDFDPQAFAIQRKSSEKASVNPYEPEKTVKSHSERSFDFGQLEQRSAIQKKSEKQTESVKPIQFEDFMGFGQNVSVSKKSVKEGIIIDTKQQKELSWGDFDVSANNANSNNQYSQNEKVQDNPSKLLQVESKKDFGSISNIDKSVHSNDKSSRNNKISRQPSLNIQDFAPLSKKGTAWNPLSMIPNLKPPSFVYMVDEKKLRSKKLELEEIKKQYEQKLAVFKFAKQKNDQIRKRLMERTSKVEEIINQKAEYIHILKKVKEDNEIKEQHILNINQRIKKVEDIKARILEKEKKLFDITKNQINTQDRKVAVQRSTANKWEMFNKSLQMHRNSSYSMTSRFTNNGLSYY